MEFIPHDYQSYCIERIENETYLGLFLRMGLGKTVTVLTALQSLLKAGKVKHILVIAPKRVAETTWSAEIAKWDHLKELKVSKILGSAKKRKEAVEADSDIYVINRENVAWLVDNYSSKWKWDTVVIDELSSFKNANAQRFKKLKRMLPKIKRVYGLTGTPAPNGMMDLWAQTYLLDRGKALGKTLTAYRNRFFTAEKKYGAGGQYAKYTIREPKAKKVITKSLEQFCISLNNSDYINLPDVITDIREVQLNRSEYRKYKTMERESVLELKGTEITAVNAGVVTNKLLQIASGNVYDTEGTINHIHSAKLEALEEIIEDAQDEPILLFYNFKHELQAIKEKFPFVRELKGEKDIIDWNNGEIKLLLAHPASAAYGLNMQSGGHIIVWFSPTWNLEQYEQANARLHRQGQREPVRVVHIIAKDTIDETVLLALEKKDKEQKIIMNALKAILDGK